MLLGGWGRLGGQGFGGAWGAGLRWGVMAAVRRRSRTFSAAGATENSAMTVNLFSVLHLPAFAGVGGRGRSGASRDARDRGAKRRFAGRIPKRRLGTTGRRRLGTTREGRGLGAGGDNCIIRG